MAPIRLYLNSSKTYLSGTRQRLARLGFTSLAAEFPTRFSLSPSSVYSIKTFMPQLHHLVRNCSYQLHLLRWVARCLSSAAISTLVHSFITVRLDYCSPLYVGLTAARLACLERLVRAAERLINRIRKFDRV